MDSPAQPLTAGDFTEAAEPFALFESWLAEARQKEINDPEAMALATVDETGLPNVRMVLLKGFDRQGPVFYTNAESAKGRELQAAGRAAALLNEVIVAEGYAVVATFPPDLRYLDRLRAAETRARADGFGLWSACR